jgi:hypothetical protein
MPEEDLVGIMKKIVPLLYFGHITIFFFHPGHKSSAGLFTPAVD